MGNYRVFIFLNHRMNANPEAPPKIDWMYYKKNIPIPGLVDKFQKEYESFKVPYPADKYTSEVEVHEKEVVQYSHYTYKMFVFKLVSKSRIYYSILKLRNLSMNRIDALPLPARKLIE